MTRFAGRHWDMEYRWGIYRFQDTRVPGVLYAQPAEKHTGAETDIAVKYYFSDINGRLQIQNSTF